MTIRVLYFRRVHPEYEVGKIYDMPDPIAAEYVASRSGEPVDAPKVEHSVAPPALEREVEAEVPASKTVPKKARVRKSR